LKIFFKYDRWIDLVALLINGIIVLLGISGFVFICHFTCNEISTRAKDTVNDKKTTYFYAPRGFVLLDVDTFVSTQFGTIISYKFKQE
jgi:hypothetical protein